MRMSEMLARPAREAPRGATLASHRLLVQGGFIREDGARAVRHAAPGTTGDGPGR